MVPFGKQQETSTLFSTADPEELSGNCRETVYEDGLLVISNEKSACVYRSSHVQVDEKPANGQFLQSQAFEGARFGCSDRTAAVMQTSAFLLWKL